MENPPAPPDGILFAALGLLTVATGMVDAASVLGLGHVFTANMTGNVVFLGFSFVVTGGPAPADCLIALVGFLVGALVGGRLATRRVPFAAAIALESALLIAASFIAWLFLPQAPTMRLPELALLGLAMGLHNASVRKLAVADMTTTVLTLTLTGLAADSSLAGGNNPRALRRLMSVALMLCGAAAGALLLRYGVKWTVGAAALVVAASGGFAAFARPALRRTPA
jgi:uncharacterized membrane protein YoaK (UPF0700 family)